MRKFNVLIVDDDDDLRFLTAQILRRDGYRVTEAANAAEAEAVTIVQTPDLVLMDIGMPGLDGLSAVWRMRERPELADVPVVILSAHDSYDLRVEAAAEGCKAYLTKPFEPRELVDKIRELLPRGAEDSDTA